jgi:hypothetical protein
MEGFWGFVVIGGPIILLVALIAGYVLNRRSNIPMSVTEEGTRRRKEEEAREEHGQDRR